MLTMSFLPCFVSFGVSSRRNGNFLFPCSIPQPTPKSPSVPRIWHIKDGKMDVCVSPSFSSFFSPHQGLDGSGFLFLEQGTLSPREGKAPKTENGPCVAMPLLPLSVSPTAGLPGWESRGCGYRGPWQLLGMVSWQYPALLFGSSSPFLWQLWLLLFL